jgi:septum formation protein
MQLVLGSTSPFRKQLLERLQLDFICDAPEIDESPMPGESIEAMVVRLAVAKARSVAERHPDALIIGSDQSAVLGSKVLTKPGGFDKAYEQLSKASGQKIVFQTGLCLLNSRTGNIQSQCIPYTVQFRQLTDHMIRSYLEKEQPYNCAGSFKSEGLGIALFDHFEGTDPSALVGLPLIQLIAFLENENLNVL